MFNWLGCGICLFAAWLCFRQLRSLLRHGIVTTGFLRTRAVQLSRKDQPAQFWTNVLLNATMAMIAFWGALAFYRAAGTPTD